MNNLVKDISTITTISETALLALIDKVINISCHSILEATLNKEDFIDLDIGIGSLHISVDSDQIRYKFIPSAKFERAILNTLETKESPLVKTLEEIIGDKIQSTYKELM